MYVNYGNNINNADPKMFNDLPFGRFLIEYPWD